MWGDAEKGQTPQACNALSSRWTLVSASQIRPRASCTGNVSQEEVRPAGKDESGLAKYQCLMSAHMLVASQTKRNVSAAGHGTAGPASGCREDAAAGAEQDGKGSARVANTCIGSMRPS